MTSSKRKSLLMTGALAAFALLILDRLVLSSYLDWRDGMVQQREAKLQAVKDARSILDREKRLHELLAGLGASITWDSSAAEGQLLHVMHLWEQSSGVTNASFQRLRTDERQGFTQLSFQITAVGTMGSVATLLYRIETSPIPLRVEEVEVRPRLEGGDNVLIYLKFTTPCKGTTARTGATHLAAADVEREPG